MACPDCEPTDPGWVWVRQDFPVVGAAAWPLRNLQPSGDCWAGPSLDYVIENRPIAQGGVRDPYVDPEVRRSGGAKGKRRATITGVGAEEYHAEQEDDLSSCDYFRGVGTCSFGCWSEPSCMTDRPKEGWPGERPKG